MRLTETSGWRALADHVKQLRQTHLRSLFADDPSRFEHLSCRHGDLLVDYSKQRLTGETMQLLRQLAQTADIAGWARRMRSGEAINHTEQRAVRHVDLRAGDAAPPEVRNVLTRMQAFCERVHSGQWRGYSGERITDVLNIGIGGSDLGPHMAVQALAARQHPDIRVHFVSNLDGADLANMLQHLSPRSTLFVIASKTFTTLETITNARTARDWLLAACGDPSMVARHFVAASTNLKATSEFGIAPENVFEFQDWVGGRFSLWSAIGLPIALAVGFANFKELLAGARDMDEHFFCAPAESNLPLTLALLALWNTNFLKAHSHGVFPYSHSLGLLPAHLQQLEMESNGKHVDRQGLPVDIATAPILWGTAGTNGQHSFFQLLHQGSELVASDFIALARSDFPLPGHHSNLLANCLAQSSALAFGQTQKEARQAGIPESLLPYRTFPGNQPSTTIVLPEQSPFTLGQLVALYEHKVFCLGVLWNLNSFDQWGVELGKQLASRLAPCLRGEAASDTLDSSTRGLIDHLRQFRT
ncbi:glucose-6-phosphate isomerase [Quatrionicoccus australiensis]|uniref:glucose-6-phosphate isomerase n=1 Tax=Quatrionicoccus australiensis TaxID=138118 RepID=UPI001CF967B5|nr:glucose-6-phosphate isomerase [Quatrionicoccus australiensis]MCB4359447.1 glucose-6-phosphate isomerase [Quatrionicoccus australiensis]